MSYNKTRRRSLTKKQRAQLFLDHDGICHICGKKIRDGELWDDEHVIAREFFEGREGDALANRAPAHRTCHKVKTKKDIKAIRKSNRVIEKHTGTVTRKKKPIKSRGFQQGHRTIPSRPFPKKRKRDDQPAG